MAKYSLSAVFLIFAQGCGFFSSDDLTQASTKASKHSESTATSGAATNSAGASKHSDLAATGEAATNSADASKHSDSAATNSAGAGRAAALRSAQKDFEKALDEGRIGSAEQILLQNRGINPSVTDKEGNTFLMLMVKAGRGLHAPLQIPSVRRTVNQRRRTKQGWETAFTVAVKEGVRFNYIKPLLDAMKENPGINPDRPTIDPLMTAVQQDRPDIVSELLKHPTTKQTINRTYSFYYSSQIQPRRRTVFHQAVLNICSNGFLRSPSDKGWEIAELLLQAGADPLISDDQGKNSLNAAVSCAHIRLIRRLLKMPSVRQSVYETKAGQETFVIAAIARSRYLYVYKLFFKETGVHPLDLNKSGDFHLTVLVKEHAKQSRADESLLWLLQSIPDISEYIDNQDRNGKTILFLTAEYGSKQSVRWLLKAGADPLITDSKGISPLEIATLEKMRSEHHSDYRETIDLLLTHASVLRNLNERELKHLSLSKVILALADRGYVRKAQSLLKSRTAQNRLAWKPERRSKPPSFFPHREIETDFHKVIRAGSLQAVSLFLEAGVDPTIPDSGGNTPLMMAAQQKGTGPDIMEELLKVPEVQKTINAVNFSGQTAIFQAVSVSFLSDASIRHAMQNHKRNLPVSAEKTLHLLFEAGADPVLPDVDGNTPLAAFVREIESSSYFYGYARAALVRMVQKFLESPAVRENINAENNDGENALSLISKNDPESSFLLKDIIKLLKENGAKLPPA